LPIFFSFKDHRVVRAGKDVIGPDEAAGANDLLVVQQAGDEADARIGILRDVHDGLG
jgi:hypothetical protein